jgi:hypothetical protein
MKFKKWLKRRIKIEKKSAKDWKTWASAIIALIASSVITNALDLFFGLPTWARYVIIIPFYLMLYIKFNTYFHKSKF